MKRKLIRKDNKNQYSVELNHLYLTFRSMSRPLELDRRQTLIRDDSYSQHTLTSLLAISPIIQKIIFGF